MAGRASSNGSAGHTGAQANLKLTFQLDHSAGADHLSLAATTAEARAANLIPLPSRLPLSQTALLGNVRSVGGYKTHGVFH